MRIVVTGGAGFIGANLCRALAASDTFHDIVALDDLSSGSADNLAGLAGVGLAIASILDDDALDRAFAGADAIVHLAARSSVPGSIEDPTATHLTNATGTIKVLEAVRRAGRPHVVIASSSALYGAERTLPAHENLATVPLSPYAASKLASEGYALAYGHTYGLAVLAFRLFNVFGPLQPAGDVHAAVIPAMVSAALRGRPLPVYGDGLQTRDFVHVRTVADVIRTALEKRVSSRRPVNLAYGSRISILDVIDTLEMLLGHPLALEPQAARVGDIRDSQADAAALRAMFPDVVPVTFADGLAETVDWMRSPPANPPSGAPDYVA